MSRLFSCSACLLQVDFCNHEIAVAVKRLKHFVMNVGPTDKFDSENYEPNRAVIIVMLTMATLRTSSS